MWLCHLLSFQGLIWYTLWSMIQMTKQITISLITSWEFIRNTKMHLLLNSLRPNWSVTLHMPKLWNQRLLWCPVNDMFFSDSYWPISKNSCSYIQKPGNYWWILMLHFVEVIQLPGVELLTVWQLGSWRHWSGFQRPLLEVIWMFRCFNYQNSWSWMLTSYVHTNAKQDHYLCVGAPSPCTCCC